jgi:hypothetical protein
MWFNILVHNHGPPDIAVPLSPILDYLQQSLRACGHSVSVSYDQLFHEAINLYIEGFHDTDFVDRLLAAKQTHRLKIGLIATELIVDNQIPYAEHGIVYAGGDKSGLLKLRLANFGRLVAQADFVWCFLARTADAYALQGRHVHYFPVGHTGMVQSAYARPPKDIDILFFGTATPHRQSVIAKLQSAGLKTIAFGRGFPAGHLPAIYMQSLIERAKIGLNLTLHAYDPSLNSIDPRFASCMRVVEMLERGVCVVSEDIPLDNPYRPFMQTAGLDQLAAKCVQLLSNDSWMPVGQSGHQAFITQMRVQDICQPVIDASLAQY